MGIKWDRRGEIVKKLEIKGERTSEAVERTGL